jgi:type IV pilus assembly protein PilW
MMAQSNQRGFSLVELMVAVTIFLFMSIAIFGVLSSNEGQKRKTTSVNDINQAGNFAAYRLGILLRRAGAGFSQAHKQTYGCLLNEVEGGTTILPATSFPTPFAGVFAITGSPRLAPVIIVKNAYTYNATATTPPKSDVLIVMSTSAGLDQEGVGSIGSPSSSTLSLHNSVTLQANDLLLIADTPGVGAMSPCLVEQIAPSTSFSPGNLPVPLAGTFYTANATTQNLSAYSLNSTAIDLGNVSNNPANPPNFLMIGVGPSQGTAAATINALFSFDILQLNGAGTAPVIVADNVMELHALYGVDTTGAGIVDSWKDPGTAPYDAATLLNGTPASNINICSIKAIRIGMLLRTGVQEKLETSGAAVTATPLTLFDDLKAAGFQYVRNLTSDEQNYRWRPFETTIALRNPIYVGNGC